jgi:hypothetical protein
LFGALQSQTPLVDLRLQNEVLGGIDEELIVGVTVIAKIVCVSCFRIANLLILLSNFRQKSLRFLFGKLRVQNGFGLDVETLILLRLRQLLLLSKSVLRSQILETLLVAFLAKVLLVLIIGICDYEIYLGSLVCH